jgi:hypothetical protein
MKIEFNPELFKKDFKKYFSIVIKEYRVSDMANHYYRKILKDNKKGLKVLLKDDEYLSLIYFTLDAWNMNQRGAKLGKFESFKKSVLNLRNNLIYFEDKNFSTIETEENKLKEIFNNIVVCTQTKKLIAHSKTLHFLLPNIFFPIDNKYTLKIFGNSKNDFKKYYSIHKKFVEIYNDKRIKKIIDEEKIELPVTKVFDNAVIGYIIFNEHEERKKPYEINGKRVFYTFKYNNNGERITEYFCYNKKI